MPAANRAHTTDLKHLKEIFFHACYFWWHQPYLLEALHSAWQAVAHTVLMGRAQISSCEQGMAVWY